jgi:hypothetical protein
MKLTVQQFITLHKLNPKIIRAVDDIAYDAEENEVAYDIDAVNAKMLEDVQSKESAKISALAKLSALGLTADEIKAITGA